MVDNFLDIIVTPPSVAAGTLLTGSFLQVDNEMVKWGLGLIIGGAQQEWCRPERRSPPFIT